MNLGLWNALRGRPPHVVAAEVARIVTAHDLDVLAVTEAQQYLRALHRLPGLRVIAFGEEPGQGNTALVVRDGARVTGVVVKRMTWRGWITVRGGETPPKWLVAATVDGVRVAVVHLPPTQRWRRGEMTGPLRRVAATAVHARRLRRWLNRQRAPWAVVGDWNATPSIRGRWSPRWVAETTRARVIAPDRPTHGQRVIDYAIVRGLVGTARAEGRHGSDHRLVVFELKEKP